MLNGTIITYTPVPELLNLLTPRPGHKMLSHTLWLMAEVEHVCGRLASLPAAYTYCRIRTAFFHQLTKSTWHHAQR